MVKVSIGSADPAAAKADLLVVTLGEGDTSFAGDLRTAAAKGLNALLKKSPFDGKEGKVVSWDAPAGVAADRVLVVGLGRGKDPSVAPSELCRRAAGCAVKKSGELGATKVAFVPPDGSEAGVLAAAEGAFLVDYSFDKHKSNGSGGARSKTSKGASDLKFEVLASDAVRTSARKSLARIESIAAGVKLARDLGNEPSNHLTPKGLADAATALAKEREKDGISCKVLPRKEIERLKMGAFLAVAQGSHDPPYFIHLIYKPKGGTSAGRKVIGLVGKGLTFDTGGISIKPASGMEDMKMDMCGAAAVLGLFRCLPDLGFEHEVHGFIAATDNMPSGSAVKPGDIVTSMAGRTIEVINTDAEGRLTLVDAITYALKSKPAVVVDLATLTGACAVALGASIGIMSNDADLRDALWDAADESGDRAWPLPLYADYRSQIQSEFADVKNIGERYGGALTAGLFLQEWVPDDLPWAHLDIAGAAWTGSEQPYQPKGATGAGVRLLARWIQDLDI